MQEPQEAYPEAAYILASAGWKPHDTWKVYTRATLVMGFQPDGQGFHVKNWGLDVHGPDTPDDPVEAAQWLVERFKPEPNPLQTEATLDPVVAELPEPEDTPQHEASAGEGGDQAGSEAPELVSGDVLEGSPEPNVQPEGAEIDADFEAIDNLGHEAEQLEVPVEDFAPDEFGEAEEQPGLAIFGDSLHQRRTSAIGLIWQHAALIMPPWSQDEHDILVEERNFAMGVAENRWPADPARTSLLNQMEAELRRIHEIERARDEKIRFVNNASHEELDAFDPAQDWP